MKKGLLFIFSFIINQTIINAQNDYRILLKTGTFTPEENIQQNNIEIISLEQNFKSVYRLIQFYDIPTSEEKNKLTALGIELYGYLPHKTFLSKIPVDINLLLLKNHNIRSIYNLKSSQKIDTKLKQQELPEWSTTGNNAKLIITFYHPENKQALISFINENQGSVLDIDRGKISMEVVIDKSKINTLANNPLVHYIEPTAPKNIKDDTEGRSLHRSNAINTDYASGRQYDGTGVSIGLADDGSIGPHIDFEGRLTQYVVANNGTHGDMTAGILCGAANLDPAIKGMAPGAYLHYYDIGNYGHIYNSVSNFNSDTIVLTSTSYSQGTGGVYNSLANAIDEILYNNPQLMHVFSAGNDGFNDHGYGAGAGWGNITGGMKAGKNVIACGNLNDRDNLEGSSSRGPADDGRIKPDICANGIGQLSTDENNTYQVGGGTSAAAPGVAGITTQLYHAYKENNGGALPDGALIKACMLNTAEDLGNPGPDFQHGWGRVNALKAARIIEDSRYIDDNISQGGNQNYTITVPSNVGQLKVMTYWADVEGSTSSSIALVNDINMQVVSPSSTTYNPWVLDPTPNVTNLNADAVRGIDNLNNVEQVTIDNPAAGNYIVSVSGNSIPQGPQHFYIVYDFVYDAVELTYPIGGEALIPNTTEVIRWDAYGSSGDFTLEYSATGGATWTLISNAVPGSTRWYEWNVPGFQTGIARVRVSRNGSVSSSTQNFTIARTPNNLHVSSVCPDTITIQWNNLSGISQYEVSMLGSKYMDPIGVTSANSFKVPGLDPNDTHWFSVRATGNGIEGRRALAIEQTGGVAGCVLSNNIATNSILSPLPGEYPSCLDYSATEITVEIENVGANPASNIDINYQINGGSIVTETYTGTINPSGVFEYTFSTTADLSSENTYEIAVWTSFSTDQDNSNDTTTSSITIYNSSMLTLSSTENFDDIASCNTTSNCEAENCDLGGVWKNATNTLYDDIDWRVDENGTPSNNTGPTVDYNLGTEAGKYIYLEVASSNCNEKTATLTSPCIDLTSIPSAQINYAYHMYGMHTGELHFDVVTKSQIDEDIETRKAGDKGNQWIHESINLEDYLGQVISFRFRGITGQGPYGDIALDAIGLSELSSIENNFSIMGVSIQPNPTNGIFSINFDKNVKNHIENIQISNVLGELVYVNQSIKDMSIISIDLGGKSNGLYYLTINTNSGSFTRKIIKE